RGCAPRDPSRPFHPAPAAPRASQERQRHMTQSPSVSSAVTNIAPRSVVVPLWPTPTLTVLPHDPRPIRRSLPRIILKQEARILGKSTPTEVAGITDGLSAHWLNFNVLHWDHPEIEEFRGLVLGGLRQWIALVGNPDDPGLAIAGISCWANVL